MALESRWNGEGRDGPDISSACSECTDSAEQRKLVVAGCRAKKNGPSPPLVTSETLLQITLLVLVSHQSSHDQKLSRVRFRSTQSENENRKVFSTPTQNKAASLMQILFHPLSAVE